MRLFLDRLNEDGMNEPCVGKVTGQQRMFGIPDRKRMRKARVQLSIPAKLSIIMIKWPSSKINSASRV